MANKFYSQNPNSGYYFTTKQDITNYFKINTTNYNAAVFTGYNLQLEPKNSDLSVANVNLGYKIAGVDIKNYVTANYQTFSTSNLTFTAPSYCKTMTIIIVGGGGGGGSGVNLTGNINDYKFSGYGDIGGGGAVYIANYNVESASDTYSVIIGGGGSGGTQGNFVISPTGGIPGNPGGNTVFKNNRTNDSLTAGGGGGGGQARCVWHFQTLPSTTPGIGGGTISGGYMFSDIFVKTGLNGPGYGNGSYLYYTGLTENINKYPGISHQTAGYSGQGGGAVWQQSGGASTTGGAGSPGYCLIYFK